MIPFFSFEKFFIFQTWGVFLALGFLIPFFLFLKQTKKARFNQNLIWDIFGWILGFSFIGMRLGYIFQYPRYFLSHFVEIFKLWDGGLTFYGGLIGGIMGIFLLKKKKTLKNKEFLQIIDLIALYFPLGIVIARIGCFLVNDHQGAITFFPWGIIWPDGTIRHPVALYLILNGLALFFVLNLFKNRLKKPGQLFFFFLLYYSISRFLLDFTRSAGTDFSDPRFYGLTYSQWFSLVLIMALVFVKPILGLVNSQKKSSHRQD